MSDSIVAAPGFARRATRSPSGGWPTRTLPPESVGETSDFARIKRGIRLLVDAILGDDVEADEGLDLDEGLEVAHLSSGAWQECLAQLEACRGLTRRQLGLRSDGSEVPAEEVTPTARGLRTFLRRMSILIPGATTIQALASELHALVYGPEAAFADVTWGDYVTVLSRGSEGQPDVWQVRRAADLIRQGVSVRDVQALTGMGQTQVEGIARFLGIKEWRQESKLRAARVALAEGWTGAQLAAEYNARANGLDEMSERSARAYLDAARQDSG